MCSSRSTSIALFFACCLLVAPATAQMDVLLKIFGQFLPAKQNPVEPQKLKVIGAGFGRTGTDSLRTALTQLGYRTHHMVEVLHSAAEDEKWAKFMKQAMEHNKVEVPALEELIDFMAVRGYNATTDFPACVLYKEFLKRYPDAKVILSVRDSARAWAKSAKSTIFRVADIGMQPPTKYLLKSTPGIVLPYVGWLTKSEFPKDEVIEEIYERWIKEVKANVPKDQLLIHNAKEGWEPLCKFLNLEAGNGCPTTPYPYENTGDEVKKAIMVLSFMNNTWPWNLFVVIGLLFTVLQWIFNLVLRRSSKVKKQ